MNMQTERFLNETESALLSMFNAHREFFAGDNKVRDARADAIAAFKEYGLPTRRVEAWHYTDLRSLMKEAHTPARRPEAAIADAVLATHDWFSSTIRLPIINGHYFPDLARNVPDEVIVSSLCEGESAFIDGTLDAANTINVLNTAFASDGLSMIVDDGESVEATVGIAYIFTGDTSAMTSARNNIVVCDGSSCNFTEHCTGPDGLAYTSNIVTNLWLGVGATARWVIIQEEGDMATHLSQLNVTLGEGSNLEIYLFNTGGKLVRREISVETTGENSSLKIRSINLAGGNSHIDVTSRLHHNVANTVSSQVYRNVASERGAGVFQGQIKVAKQAQKTDAAMACNTLLLSDECSFFTKPELEIFADDVLCAHGATISDLEEDHLFYLMARGIPEDLARGMLVKAFLYQVLDELDDQVIVEAMVGRIDHWLDNHLNTVREA